MYFELTEAHQAKYGEALKAYDEQIMRLYQFAKNLEDIRRIGELSDSRDKLYEKIELEEFDKVEKKPESMIKEAKKHFDYIYNSSLAEVKRLDDTVKVVSTSQQLQATVTISRDYESSEAMGREQLIRSLFYDELKLFFNWLDKYDFDFETKYSDQLREAVNKHISSNLNEFRPIAPTITALTVGVSQADQRLITAVPERTAKGEYYWVMPDETKVTLSNPLSGHQLDIYNHIVTLYYYATEHGLKPCFTLSYLFKEINGQDEEMKESSRLELIRNIHTLRRTDAQIEVPLSKRKKAKVMVDGEEYELEGKLQSFVNIEFYTLSRHDKNGKKYTITCFEIKELPPLAKLNKAFGTNQYINKRYLTCGNHRTDNALITDGRQRKQRTDYDFTYLCNAIAQRICLGARAMNKQSEPFKMTIDTLYDLADLEVPEKRLDHSKPYYKDNLRKQKSKDKKRFTQALEEMIRRKLITKYEWYTKGSLAESTQQKKEHRNRRSNEVVGVKVWITEEAYKEHHEQSRKQAKK